MTALTAGPGSVPSIITSSSSTVDSGIVTSQHGNAVAWSAPTPTAVEGYLASMLRAGDAVRDAHIRDAVTVASSQSRQVGMCYDAARRP